MYWAGCSVSSPASRQGVGAARVPSTDPVAARLNEPMTAGSTADPAVGALIDQRRPGFPSVPGPNPLLVGRFSRPTTTPRPGSSSQPRLPLGPAPDQQHRGPSVEGECRRLVQLPPPVMKMTMVSSSSPIASMVSSTGRRSGQRYRPSRRRSSCSALQQRIDEGRPGNALRGRTRRHQGHSFARPPTLITGDASGGRPGQDPAPVLQV